VTARGRYDAEARTYTLTLAQQCGPSPGQPTKQPFVIPVATGLVDRDGAALPLRLAPGGEAAEERLLVLDQPSATWTFHDVEREPVPSLLRGFSAPVVVDDGLDDAALLVLLAHDPDPFNRWEAGQRLALARMQRALAAHALPHLDDAFVDAMRHVLRHPLLAPAFKELVLTLPSEAYVAETLSEVDPQRLHAVREAMRTQLATRLHADWVWAWETHQVREGYRPDMAQSGQRALANLALSMLCLHAVEVGDPVWPGRAYQRVKDAGNMTQRLGALRALVHAHAELAQPALERFHAMFRGEALVIDKWFALQASAPERDGAVFARVKALLAHPDFTLANPNRARSLLHMFCQHNAAGLHRADGAGVRFWADRLLELDAKNPQLASRLARAMDRWRHLAEPYRGLAREAIAGVAAHPTLSNDVREIVTRALED
jgi:aminopeptidase N